MPKTGPYDELVARKEDGYSQDIWDSDTDKGRERIRRREAEAAGLISGPEQRATFDHQVKATFRREMKPIHKDLTKVVKTIAERLHEKDEEVCFLHNRLVIAEEALSLPMRRLDGDRDEALAAAKEARERQAAGDGKSGLEKQIEERVKAAIAEERKTLRAAAAQIEVEWKEMLLGLEREKLELETLKRDMLPSRRLKVLP